MIIYINGNRRVYINFHPASAAPSSCSPPRTSVHVRGRRRSAPLLFFFFLSSPSHSPSSSTFILRYSSSARSPLSISFLSFVLRTRISSRKTSMDGWNPFLPRHHRLVSWCMCACMREGEIFFLRLYFSSAPSLISLVPLFRARDG